MNMKEKINFSVFKVDGERRHFLHARAEFNGNGIAMANGGLSICTQMAV